MLDRTRDPEGQRGAERAARPPEPAPPVQFGTLGWASAMGNHAVARLARQSVEAPPELESEVEAMPEAPMAGIEEAEATPEGSSDLEVDAAGPEPEELPEELPE